MAVLTAALTALPLVLLAVPAHAKVEAAWCSGNGAGRCANRYQGGTGQGTLVITYTHDLDAGEDFAENPVYLCNGTASVTSTCPFTNTSIDARYLGDLIADIPAYNQPGLCLGDNASDYEAELVACPNDNNGQGGGTGTIVVISSSNYAVSRQATNNLGKIEWICDGGQSLPLFMDSASSSSACQWQDATS